MAEAAEMTMGWYRKTLFAFVFAFVTDGAMDWTDSPWRKKAIAVLLLLLLFGTLSCLYCGAQYTMPCLLIRLL